MSKYHKALIIAMSLLFLLTAGAFGSVAFIESQPIKKILLSASVIGMAGLGAALSFELFQSQKRRLERMVAENFVARQNERPQDDPDYPFFENLEVDELKAEVEKIKELISKIGELELTEVANQLRESIVADTTNELVAELKKKIHEDDTLKSARISMRTVFGKSEERLADQVQTLRAQSTTNMVVGCFIALLGALFLAATLFLSNAKAASFEELALQMAPRLSVVILIEVFAYFFLKMYRSNLSEIRYYQNEITNVEMRRAGVFLAVSKAASETVLEKLCSTDRNFVIEKEQTTQELEKLKIERDSTKNIIDTLTSILKKD